mgnify:CR=1 FL=1
MNCTNHENVEASGMCTYCGKPFCKDCLVEVKGKMYCKNDLDKVFDEKESKNAADQYYKHKLKCKHKSKRKRRFAGIPKE